MWKKVALALIRVLFYLTLYVGILLVMFNSSPSLRDVAFVSGIGALFGIMNHFDLKAIKARLNE